MEVHIDDNDDVDDYNNNDNIVKKNFQFFFSEHFLSAIAALYLGSSLTDSLTDSLTHSLSHSLTGATLGQSVITQSFFKIEAPDFTW